MTRGDFLSHLFQQAKTQLGQYVDQQIAPIRKPLTAPSPFLRPPGAHTSDTLFMTLCTRCDACTAACPHGAISVHYGAGYPYDGTPVLADLVESPCLMCADLPCIAACPTEALQPLADIAAIQIGEAKIDNTTCLAYRGQSCTVCHDVCPLAGEAIALVEGLPQVYAACTGCGICSARCPTGETSIRVFPRQHAAS